MDWEKVYAIMKIICLPIYWFAKAIVWIFIMLIGAFILFGVIPELFCNYWTTGYSELHTIGKDLYIEYNVDRHRWERISLANRNTMKWYKPVEAELIPMGNIENGYIESYGYDSLWVVLKYVIPTKKDTIFYILDKSFNRNELSIENIRENYILQFTDSLRFAEECNEKQITLTFEKL